MIDINIVNAITIGIISLIAWAFFKFIVHYFGLNVQWAN